MTYLLEIFDDITPARRKALIAISNASYFNHRSSWSARGHSTIQGMVVDWLINNNLVKKISYQNASKFGHRLVLTGSGRDALTLLQEAA